MSDANRIKIRRRKEATFATPAGGTYQEFNLTSESLGQDTGTVASATIRSDRQVADFARVSINAGGDVNFEFQYGQIFDDTTSDPLAAGIFQSEPVAKVTPGGGPYTGSDTTVTGVATDFNSIVVGEWVRLTSAGNNFYGKVTAKAGDGSTIDVDRAHGMTSGITCLQGRTVTNGTTLITYTIEKEYTDLSSEFEQLLGMAPNSFSLSGQNEQIITGTIGWLGKSASTQTSSDASGNDAASTKQMLNTIDHMTAILENSTQFNLTAFDFAMNNNLRARQEMGSLGAVSIGTGTLDVSGSITAYFDNTPADIIDKYLNFTATNLALAWEDTAGNGTVLEMPEVRYSAGRRVAGGTNQDIMAALDFAAFMDASESKTVRMVVWDA